MKIASALVVLAIMLAAMAAGLSYSGYNERLQTVTSTDIRSYTTTLTNTIVLTSTESFVTVTNSTVWLLRDEVIDLDSELSNDYCGTITDVALNLTAGQVHISFKTTTEDPSRIHFLMPITYNDYFGLMIQSRFSGCAVGMKSGAYADFTAQVPSDGEYYFVFLNYARSNRAKVVLSVDQPIQSTITGVRTVYSTQQTTVTNVSTTSILTVTNAQSSIDYRLPLALGAIAVVVVIAALLLMRRKSIPPTLIEHPAVAPSSASPLPTKFCRNCGAKIPRDSKHCEECGTRLS